jgi:hypothetical protein
MPMNGCCCFGGNTPELARYCGCRGIGDREHFGRVNAAMQPLLDLANMAYADGDELTAMMLAGEADEVGWRVS